MSCIGLKIAGLRTTGRATGLPRLNGRRAFDTTPARRGCALTTTSTNTAADVPMIVGAPRIYGRVYITTGGRGVIYGDIGSAK
jgi:hypothetical protein